MHHGEWLPYLSDIDMNRETAQRFMRLSSNYMTPGNERVVGLVLRNAPRPAVGGNQGEPIRDKGLNMKTIILILIGMLSSGFSVTSEGENSEYIAGPHFKSWRTHQKIDTFFDNEIFRVAYLLIQDDDGLATVGYKCANGSLVFEGIGNPSLTADGLLNLKTTDVLIKVDDGPNH